MKDRYYWCSYLDESLEIFIGNFETEKDFWIYFDENKEDIINKQKSLSSSYFWFMKRKYGYI